MKKEVVEINVDKCLDGDTFYVCNVQIRAPFWSEVFKGNRRGNLFFAWSDVLEKRKEKVCRILKEIEAKYIDNGFNIRLVVFPEYSIESCMVQCIKEFSRKNNVVVVAGDYDSEKRRCFARIIYAEGDENRELKQNKLTVSRYDREYLSEISDDERIVFKLVWNDKENIKHFLHVYVCHDFIESGCDMIDEEANGLYVVIMCSPKIEEFYGLSYVMMRARSDGKSSVVLLSNSADNPLQMKKKDEGISCGETQIVCHSKDALPKIERYAEGGILAEICLSGMVSKLTPIKDKPVIKNIKNFSIDNNEGFIRDAYDVCAYSEPCVLINPNAIISILGLKKIYTIFCIKSYSKLIGALQALPLQSNSVFGVYDILIKSYEESYDFFDKRLMSHLGEKYFELRDPDLPQREVFTVKSVLKYRGQALVKIEDGNIIYSADYGELDQNYIDDNVCAIKKVMLGENIVDDKKQDLIQKSILMMAKCDSDLFPDDEKGCEEYLIFIKIYHTNEKSRRVTSREFRRFILPVLMDDYRVRTIELCADESDAENSHDWDYIVHFVGELKDLREVIIKEVHEKTRDIDIRCRTFVVITAGMVNTDKHVYLTETVVRDPMLMSFVLEMIVYMKHVDPMNPFIIKKVSVEMIKLLRQAYLDYKRIVDNDGERGLKLNKFNHFVYGVCWAYIEDVFFDKNIYEKIKGWCFETYVYTSEKIEAYFDDEKQKINSEISACDEGFFEEYLSKKIARNKVIRDVIDSNQTVLGDLCKAVYHWEVMFGDGHESYINDIVRVDDVARLRNLFSHRYKSSLSSRRTREFSVQLMDIFSFALGFIRRYCD